jgi:hypothetical protein
LATSDSTAKNLLTLNNERRFRFLISISMSYFDDCENQRVSERVSLLVYEAYLFSSSLGIAPDLALERSSSHR